MIKKIVEDVSGKLNNKNLFLAPYLVGINSRLQAVSSMLLVGLNDTVRMVGILGSGGIGKTTIAKAIYNQFCEGFEGSSFLPNVREIWNQPLHRVYLQEQLLFDTLKKKTKVGNHNLDRGMMVIKERLCHKRVLVIIDDVDCLEQLNAIAGSRDWFGRGSRIVITTRDKHLLKLHEVDAIYIAQEMDDTESLELFSWHAFRRSSPIEENFELSKSVAAYCGGLPLALKVLGSSLFGRSTKEWRNTLEKLRRITHHEIQEKLKSKL